MSGVDIGGFIGSLLGGDSMEESGLEVTVDREEKTISICAEGKYDDPVITFSREEAIVMISNLDEALGVLDE